jgi:hypothetical protein
MQMNAAGTELAIGYVPNRHYIYYRELLTQPFAFESSLGDKMSQDAISLFFSSHFFLQFQQQMPTTNPEVFIKKTFFYKRLFVNPRIYGIDSEKMINFLVRSLVNKNVISKRHIKTSTK